MFLKNRINRYVNIERKTENTEEVVMSKKRVLVFASGDAEGGGSGFRELAEFSRTDPPILDAEVVGVVSNHEHGGVRKGADEYGIPLEFWSGPFDSAGYQARVVMFDTEFIMCSGWLKLVKGLDQNYVLGRRS